jgi:hypothetical protein
MEFTSLCLMASSSASTVVLALNLHSVLQIGDRLGVGEFGGNVGSAIIDTIEAAELLALGAADAPLVTRLSHLELLSTQVSSRPGQAMVLRGQPW